MAEELRVWVTQGDKNMMLALVHVQDGKPADVKVMKPDAAGALFKAASSTAIWMDFGDKAQPDPDARAVEFHRSQPCEISTHIQLAQDFHWAKSRGADKRMLGSMRATMPQVATLLVTLGELLGTPIESIKLRPLDAAENKSEKTNLA